MFMLIYKARPEVASDPNEKNDFPIFGWFGPEFNMLMFGVMMNFAPKSPQTVHSNLNHEFLFKPNILYTPGENRQTGGGLSSSFEGKLFGNGRWGGVLQ